MKLEELTIKEAREIAKMFGGVDGTRVEDPKGEIEIVVLDRGWVVVGQVSIKGEEVVIKKGHVIRRWGTTNGLGQIAQEGPTADTKLEAAPLIKTTLGAVVCRFGCDQDKWDKLCR